ncbi:MAG TPA: hypothetical protein VJ934_07320, partial [Desulfomicrobiaceae bacterium]|nr:hypothetical protein [Desulfomicrobiaceae bacterium]
MIALVEIEVHGHVSGKRVIGKKEQAEMFMPGFLMLRKWRSAENGNALQDRFPAFVSAAPKRKKMEKHRQNVYGTESEPLHPKRRNQYCGHA